MSKNQFMVAVRCGVKPYGICYGILASTPSVFKCPKHHIFKNEKSPVYTLQLSQKSDFQPSTTKPDNIGHSTVKTGQIWPRGGFEGGFPFCEN